MLNHLKVLIAEDCVEFDQNNSRVFDEYGFESYFISKDGLRVIEMIKEKKPDVVIMDLFMPRADAIAVIKKITQNNAITPPIFIVLSNFASPVLERESMQAGASYFAIKPFSLKDLAERILQFTSARKLGTLAKNDSMGDKQSNNGKDLEVKVTEMLHQIGVPAHIKGYHYLRNSIIMSVENPDIINAVTKQLYPAVAKNFSTTSSRVERAIRHAIEVAWDRGDVDVLNSYFGYTIHNGRGKPTNSEFIAMISDKLRLQVKSAS